MTMIKVILELPADVGEHARNIAQARAEEATVLALWQQEQLTLREAADELGLSYRQFLDLLADRSIPIEQGPTDGQALEKTRGKLASGPP